MLLTQIYKRCLITLLSISVIGFSMNSEGSIWILIDDFEAPDSVAQWSKADTKNDTSPKINKPQITLRLLEARVNNAYLLKKPAAEGIIGNRKALTYKKLPIPVPVGKTFTFYSRINVESFPNNHAFGLSNLSPKDIELNDYNAFEATLRVTDKKESSGLINTGALMVKVKGVYANIFNIDKNKEADPLIPGRWYEIWYVVDNSTKKTGGQSYTVYIKGGDEFSLQTQVYKNATFRMARELPLIYFLMNCNTGPKNKPYGNGGLRYDDLYMSAGVNLTTPMSFFNH